MRKGVFCILLLSACGVVAKTQTPTKNYILGKQGLDANGNQTITTITYYDDLGYEDEVATTGLGGQGKYRYTKKESAVHGQVAKEWISGVMSSDGNTLQVFTDVVGRKVLERRANSNDTYYIYDDLGLLRFVLSPSYQEEANLEKYGYEYRYPQIRN